MKKWLLLLLVACASVANAQSQLYMLSGQVTNAADKPVKNATVQAVSADKLVFATSDSDGLYATGAATVGRYEVLVKVGVETWVAPLEIKKGDPVARFYNIRLLASNKAQVIITTEDPYKAVAYAHLRKSKNYIDAPPDRPVSIEPIKKQPDETHPTPKKKK